MVLYTIKTFAMILAPPQTLCIPPPVPHLRRIFATSTVLRLHRTFHRPILNGAAPTSLRHPTLPRRRHLSHIANHSKASVDAHLMERVISLIRHDTNLHRLKHCMQLPPIPRLQRTFTASTSNLYHTFTTDTEILRHLHYFETQ
jgi:hypothetical protein